MAGLKYEKYILTDLRLPSDGLKLDALADHDDGLRKFCHAFHMDNFSFQANISTCFRETDLVQRVGFEPTNACATGS